MLPSFHKLSIASIGAPADLTARSAELVPLKICIRPSEVSQTYLPFDGYRYRFGTIWTLAVLAILGVIATLVVCISAVSDGAVPSEAVVGFVLCGLTTVTFIAMSTPSAQIRFRAGSGFFGGVLGIYFERGSAAPSTAEEVRTLYQDSYATPVGGAWSCSLAQRFSLPFPRVYTHNLTAKTDPDTFTWLAGAKLKTVQNELAKDGKQLIGVPSSSYVTVGGWVATLAHGNGTINQAAEGMPPILEDVKSARVLNTTTKDVTVDDPAMLVQKFGNGDAQARKFFVLDVTLKENLPFDQFVIRSSFLVNKDKDAARFLYTATLMRVLFVGQRASLVITWTEEQNSVALGCCARLVNSIVEIIDKVRIFTLAGLGWGKPNLSKHSVREKVSDAVYFFPDTITNVQNLVQVYMRYVNAEFFTKDLSNITSAKLLNMTRRLQETHASLGGRTELRIHGSIVYFDVAMRETRSNFATYLSTLHKLGVRNVAQHRGKHQRVRNEFATACLNLVNASEVLRPPQNR